MLSVPEKKTSSAELFRDRHLFTSEKFTSVRQTRHNIIEKPLHNPSLPSLTTRLGLVRNYKLSLSSLDDPCSFDDDLSFTWHDSFKPKFKTTQKNIDFEKICVVFNIGAVHSQIGALTDREAEEGRKKGCLEFQKAAGAFKWVKERAEEGKLAGGGGELTVDLSVECLAMLGILMLAQAQDCVLETAVKGGKSHGVCSKVARQASLYYEEAYKALDASPLDHHLDRLWVSFVQLKSALFHADACYHYAIELHEKTEIAEEIARLKFGIETLDNAKKATKRIGVAVFLPENLSTLENDMQRDLQRAMDENNRIYLMRVPQISSLEPLKAVSLVKSVSIDQISIDANN